LRNSYDVLSIKLLIFNTDYQTLKNQIMKKLVIGIMSLALSISVSSCKENKETDSLTDETEQMNEDAHGHEHTHDGETHSHSHDDMHHDDASSLMVGKELMVPMSAKSGSNVSGTIAFVQGEKEVTMNINLEGLTEGAHAIHIHQNGDCSSDDGKSAGGHWDPTSEDHGKWGDNMHHSGDIGNLEVGTDGKASLEFSTDQWCIGCDDEKRNIVGKGVIVHASADDFKSQPSGAAGAREACGVIE
jgi:Cu-Zn family superoxide dismutase